MASRSMLSLKLSLSKNQTQNICPASGSIALYQGTLVFTINEDSLCEYGKKFSYISLVTPFLKKKKSYNKSSSKFSESYTREKYSLC